MRDPAETFFELAYFSNKWEGSTFKIIQNTENNFEIFVSNLKIYSQLVSELKRKSQRQFGALFYTFLHITQLPLNVFEISLFNMKEGHISY